MLSNRLEKFKSKSGNLYNMRCPFCNDSSKSKNKARGYLYLKSDKYQYHCHNCNVTKSFSSFLREIDNGLYDHYLQDCLINNNTGYIPKPIAIVKNHSDDSLRALESIVDLSKKHPARVFIEKRKIPEQFWDTLYFCPRFKEFTNTLIPNKFENVEYEEERIIIPFYDTHKKFFGFQGRSLAVNAAVRYITIILNDLSPKIYGLNRVDFNRTYYVVEGPFDSMFLSNAIATAGGKISSELMKLKCNMDNAVIVYDNEPRNKNVVDNIRKSVITNWKTVIWPDNNHYKDINDMYLAGIDVNKAVKENTYSGLEAQLRFEKWKKI